MVSRKVISFFLMVVVVAIGINADEEKKEEEKLTYTRPSVSDTAYFSEPFHSAEEFSTRWVHSQAKKDGVEASIAKYDGIWKIAEPKDNAMVGDNGLILSSQAKHAAISSSLNTPFKFDDKTLIVQYEVRFQNKHECGGAYVKLLADTPSLKLNDFTDKTEYTIMFGPDRCGGDSKLHFIFQHENPTTNKMEEKHAKKPASDFGNIFEDGKTHLVTLVVKPDNTYEILVDRKQLSSGSLLKDMEPPVNPPKMIDDPEDKKPEDWDEREKIPDPDATKPDDWDEDAPEKIEDPAAVKPSEWLDDEPELIPDPAAVKPADWDEEEDGEWEAPQIDNPKCKLVGCGEWKPPIIKNPNFKGKWSSPLIANPKYKGIWAPKKIENPNFFEDTNPFAMKTIAAVGFELWSMQSDILFDNVIIADDQSIVDQWTVQTWELKRKQEQAGDSASMTGMWEQFKQQAEEKPWLWVVAAACLFVPIVIIIYMCMGGKEEDKAARSKKTDEPQPDDEESDQGEKTEESEKAGTEEESEPLVAEATKEEPKITEITDDKEEEKPVEKETKEVKAEKEEIKQDDQNEDEATEESAQASPSPRTRSKRKARKDN